MFRRERGGGGGRLHTLPLKSFLHSLGVLCGEIKCITALSIFKALCRGCGCDLVFNKEIIICHQCRQDLFLDRGPSCRLCGRFLTEEFQLCGECLIHPPPFEKHVSYSRYQNLLKELILAMKYGGLEPLKYLFADLYIEMIREKFSSTFDCLVPIPSDRGRKRDFAPNLEIARVIASKTRLPLVSEVLFKCKKTLPQAGLSRANRLKNLDGAFKLKNIGAIAGKKVLLMDDVYTTGTTIQKCSGILFRAGATVSAITLARS
jgi:ComF family protein